MTSYQIAQIKKLLKDAKLSNNDERYQAIIAVMRVLGLDPYEDQRESNFISFRRMRRELNS